MVGLRSEEEQIEALKQWWKTNGWSTVATIVAVLALYAGWQAWQTRQAQYDIAASMRYQQLLPLMLGLEREVSEAELGEVEQTVAAFVADFGDTTYARYATLLLARYQVAGGDLEGAEAQLRWVLEQGGDQPTAHLAQLRLARVLFAQGKAEQATAIAESVEGGAFATGFYELRGDISSAGGDPVAARRHYQRALAQGSVLGGGNPLVQMKLDALPAEKTEPASSEEQEG